MKLVAFAVAAMAALVGAQQPATANNSNLRGKPAVKVNGEKLKMLINCYADYMENAAYRFDNSKRDGCQDKDIVYCRTDAGHDDKFCKFSGTNFLKEDPGASPKCWFNCQMETCNAWDIPKSDKQRGCVKALAASA